MTPPRKQARPKRLKVRVRCWLGYSAYQLKQIDEYHLGEIKPEAAYRAGVPRLSPGESCTGWFSFTKEEK